MNSTVDKQIHSGEMKMKMKMRDFSAYKNKAVGR